MAFRARTRNRGIFSPRLIGGRVVVANRIEERVVGNSGWSYHPLEIVVKPSCGDSVLARRLAKELSGELRIGLVRHGALATAGSPDRLDQDALEGGVWGLVAANGKASLAVRDGHLDLFTQRSILADADLVVVDGGSDSASMLVVELDANGGGLERIPASRLASVAAVVGAVRPVGQLPSGGVAWFAPDRLEALIDHLLGLLEERLRARPMWGLALPGADARTVQALGERCARVFQAQDGSGAEPIASRHPALGDLGWVLSCLESYPDTAFLVAGGASDGVDLDLVCQRRNPLRMATACREDQTHLPIPDPVVWEPKARLRIHQALGAGIHCVQRILTHSHIELLDPRQNS